MNTVWEVRGAEGSQFLKVQLTMITPSVSSFAPLVLAKGEEDASVPQGSADMLESFNPEAWRCQWGVQSMPFLDHSELPQAAWGPELHHRRCLAPRRFSGGTR